MYKVAIMEGYRYPSSKGYITTEDLMDMPLTQKANPFSLNNVAKELAKLIREEGDNSFITASSTKTALLEAKLNLVKDVIKTKLEIIEHKKNIAAKASKRSDLINLIAAKDAEEQAGKSKDELLMELAALGGNDE